MTTSREMALEQALIAVLGAVKDSSLDVDSLSGIAKGYILDSSSKYQKCSDHAVLTEACSAISDALSKI